MLFKTLAIGLLGLASESFSGLVSARALSNVHTLDTRAVDWPGMAILKLGDIASNIDVGAFRFLSEITPEGQKAKDIFDGIWRVKIAERVDQVETEIAAYKDVSTKDITARFLSLIESDTEAGKIIGFAIENLKDAAEFDKNSRDDKERARAILNKMHEAGWAHEDAAADNFLKANGRDYVIDFEISKRLADGDAEKLKKDDWETLDESFGMYDEAGNKLEDEDDIEEEEEEIEDDIED